MNWKRAALAARAGVAGVTVICAGLYALLAIALYSADFMPFSDNRPSAVQWLLMLTIPPVIASVGGALPARALGVRWSRSLAIALVAHVIAIFVLVMMLRWEPFDDLGSYVATPFVIAAALTVLLAARYGRATAGPRVVAAITAVAAFLALLTLLFSYSAAAIPTGLSAWILLPTLAGLVLSRSQNERLP